MWCLPNALLHINHLQNNAINIIKHQPSPKITIFMDGMLYYTSTISKITIFMDGIDMYYMYFQDF